MTSVPPPGAVAAPSATTGLVPPAGVPAPTFPLVPLIVAGLMFMETLDATVIVTALPAMGRTMHTGPTNLSLGISLYMLAVAVCVPFSAWAGDRFGSRRTIMIAILLFTLSSALCGLCNTAPAFVALRVIQGAAAAMMSPAGRLLVIRQTPKAELIGVVAILTWPALIAPVLGPPLGGLLTMVASWRWIFFINVPLGLIGTALTWRFIPQRLAPTARFDLTGFVLLAAALATLIYGLDLVANPAGGWRYGVALVMTGILLGAVTVRHLRLAAHPIVALTPMALASFRISAITGGTLTRIAVGATPFLLPLLFQLGFGLDPLRAGGLVLVYFLGNLGMKLFTSAAIRRFGFRRIVLINGILLALSVAACASLARSTQFAVLAVVLLASGATRSLQFTSLNTLAFADLAPADTGAANTLNTLAQQIAGMMGVALAAATLHLAMGSRGAKALGVADFRVAFIVVALVGLSASLFYFRLGHRSGSEVSGHRAAGDPA